MDDRKHPDEAPVHEEHLRVDDHDDEGMGHEGEDLAPIDPTMMATIATVGVVGVGVVMLEAALLPGVALGVAAVAAPKYLPRLGSAMAPLFRSTVRGVYKAAQKTREFVAEAHEHVGDIVAEVEAEGDRSQAPEHKS